MSTTRRKPPASLALMAAPWPLYNRPSIQLGALKAYLRQHVPALRIDAHHLYLPLAAAIGYDTYRAISERTWLAEAVYAALLFPEHFEKTEAFFRRRAVRDERLRRTPLRELSARVQQHTDRLLAALNWDDFAVAGFSVSLCQLSATLYALRRVKQIAPHVTCVVGGSTFSGIPPGPVFDLFADIDLIVSGEGELPLAHLAQCHLVEGTPLDALPPIKGIHTRRSTQTTADSGFDQMTSLKRLPPPDYDDYFDLLASLPTERHFFATLPLELSRGCWWQRRSSGCDSGCAFCNLNLQWRGYRQKSANQATSEIDRLTSRHQTLSIAFADNILPAGKSGRLFESLCGLQKDLHLFGEIRATTRPADLERMQAAGMQEVQIGIEALSSRLLRKMNKGTRAIENLAIMKHCEELGLKNVSNLILLFPGSDARDVDETLRTLEFTLPFRPLKPVDFWLGMGSPLWQNPQAAGIRAIFNHRHWARLFPAPIARRFPFIVQGYRGDRGRQRRLWQPVRSALKSWERTWHQLHSVPQTDPILSYRDGRDFVVIRQRRPAAPALTHRLTDASGRIYLYCRQPQPFARICAAFEGLSAEKIDNFLELMVSKRLMFKEKKRFLSLAVAVKPRCAR